MKHKTKRLSTDYLNTERNSGSLKRMFLGIIESKEIIFQLAYRDFTVRYRQSYLGYLWAILPQLVTLSIFTFLASRRVFDMSETNMPYVVHAVWSLSLWLLFSTILLNCTNSLAQAGTLVTKVCFPKESIVIASISPSIIDFIIRLLPISFIILWVDFTPSINSFWIIFIVLIVIMLALGIGLILAIINLVFKDLGNIVGMLMTFGMFLSPILYPPPVQYPFNLINILNPFSPLLISTQELLSGNVISHPTLLILVSIFSIVILILGLRIFSIALPKVIDNA